MLGRVRGDRSGSVARGRMGRAVAVLLASCAFVSLTSGGALALPLGTFTEFRVPTTLGTPAGIAVGRDGDLWFTELIGNKIGRITPTGSITEFPIPTAGSQPNGIAAGPDGAMWFTEQGRNIEIDRAPRPGRSPRSLVHRARP